MKFTVTILALLLFITSCKEEKDSKVLKPDNSEPEWVMSDSITFKIELPPESSLLLNLEDKYFDNLVLEWENESGKDSVFTTTIPRYHKVQTVENIYHKNREDFKKFKLSWHNFIIDSLTDKIFLKVDGDQIEVIGNDPSIDISELRTDYYIQRVKIFKRKESNSELLVGLDSLKQHYDKLHIGQELNKTINLMHYYDKLYDIDSSKVPIDSLMHHIDLTITSSAGRSLIFKYLDDNIKSIGFELLNPSSSNETSKVNSKIYERNLAIGVLRYLRFKDSKGNNLYPEARNWLKRTKFYQENKEEIDSQIEAPDNAAFKKALSELEIVDVNFKKSSINEIVKLNQSSYYLIDLWATWCVPCINGMKLMDQMDFPKNVKVISLSTDYKKDKELWQTKSQELDLDINFMILDKEDNKEFYKFINMKSIPRYLLMDSKLNLIDMAFYQPHEPQFISKLRDVGNHTNW